MKRKSSFYSCKKTTAIVSIGLYITVLILCLLVHSIRIKKFNDIMTNGMEYSVSSFVVHLDVNKILRLELFGPVYIVLFALFALVAIATQVFGLVAVCKEHLKCAIVYAILSLLVLVINLTFGVIALLEPKYKKSYELMLIVPFALLTLCLVGLYIHALNGIKKNNNNKIVAP